MQICRGKSITNETVRACMYAVDLTYFYYYRLHEMVVTCIAFHQCRYDHVVSLDHHFLKF